MASPAPASPALSDAQRQQLIAQAHAARQQAYVPYSHFPVGAAILTSDGAVFTGCNIEIASFGATSCGERTAAFKAVSEGHRRFDAVAVVTEGGVSPCGICRQVLFEFGPQMWVIMADVDGHITWEGPLTDLLPHSFGPGELAAHSDHTKLDHSHADHVHKIPAHQDHADSDHVHPHDDHGQP